MREKCVVFYFLWGYWKTISLNFSHFLGIFLLQWMSSSLGIIPCWFFDSGQLFIEEWYRGWAGEWAVQSTASGFCFVFLVLHQIASFLCSWDALSLSFWHLESYYGWRQTTLQSSDHCFPRHFCPVWDMMSREKTADVVLKRGPSSSTVLPESL